MQRVADIAKGRVWTGVQAQQLGLVDKLGGLALAVSEAKRLANLSSGTVTVLKVTPSHKSPLDMLQRMAGLGGASVQSLAAAAQVLGDPKARAVMDELARARLQADGQAAVLAPTPIR